MVLGTIFVGYIHLSAACNNRITDAYDKTARYLMEKTQSDMTEVLAAELGQEILNLNQILGIVTWLSLVLRNGDNYYLCVF